MAGVTLATNVRSALLVRMSRERRAERAVSERAERWVARLTLIKRALLLLVVGTTPTLMAKGAVLDPFDVPKLGLLLTGVSCVALLKSAELLLGGSGFGFQRLLLPSSAIVIPLVVSWVFSPHQTWALLGDYQRFQGLVPSLAVIALGLFLADAFAGHEPNLLWGLTISGAVVGVYALVQLLGLDPYGDPLALGGNEFVPSTLGHSNFAGGFLAIALCSAVGLWIRGERVGRWAAACSVPIVVGLVGTFSQGGWAAAVGGVALTVGAAHRHKNRLLWRTCLCAAALVCVVVVGSVIVSMAAPHGPFAGTSVMTRSLHWRTAISMAMDSLLVGKGPNAFAIEGIGYRPSLEALILGWDVADDPHSVPLAILANLGVLGLSGFLTLIGWVAYRARRLAGAVPAAFLGVVAAYLIQSLVSIDELSLRIALWVGLVGLALTTREEEKASRSLSRSRWLLWPACLVMLALSLGALLLSWKIVIADHHALQMNRALMNDDLSQARERLNLALASRDEPEYGILFGQEVTRIGVEHDLPPALVMRDLRDAFGSVEELSQFRAIASYADGLRQLAHESPTAARDALAMLSRARQLDPHNPLVVTAIADVLLLQERPEAAWASLQPFVPSLSTRQPEYVRPFPEFWGALAITAIDLRDERTARQALATGRSLGPFECHVLIADSLLSVRTGGPTSRVPIEIGFACQPSIAALLLDVKPANPR